MIDFNADQARRYMNTMYPNETHSLPGDCINPKCGYHFTDADKESIERNDGWFVCPKCGTTYDYFKDPVPGQGGYTRSGLTMGEMGTIGETIVERMGTIPQLGAISWVSPDYHSPVDLIAGNFGCEIKTNHSEAQARFKVSGGSQVEVRLLSAVRSISRTHRRSPQLLHRQGRCVRAARFFHRHVDRQRSTSTRGNGGFLGLESIQASRRRAARISVAGR
jgi:hypothetical protein